MQKQSKTQLSPKTYTGITEKQAMDVFKRGNVLITEELKTNTYIELTVNDIYYYLYTTRKSTERPSLYEVSYMTPCRCYLDIEYRTPKKKTSLCKKIIKELSEQIKDSKYITYCASREKKNSSDNTGLYYNSYRVVFPNQVFENPPKLRIFLENFQKHLIKKKILNEKTKDTIDLSCYNKGKQKIRLPYSVKYAGAPDSNNTIFKLKKSMSTVKKVKKSTITYRPEKKYSLNKLKIFKNKKKEMPTKKVGYNFKVFKKSNNTSESENENISSSTIDVPVVKKKKRMKLTVKQISDLLDIIATKSEYYDDREKWLKVIFCIQNEVLLTEDIKKKQKLFDLADSFSKKSSKYSGTHDVFTKMGEYKITSNPISVNTLYYFAKNIDELKTKKAVTVNHSKRKLDERYTFYDFVKDWCKEFDHNPINEHFYKTFRHVFAVCFGKHIAYLRSNGEMKSFKMTDISTTLNLYSVTYKTVNSKGIESLRSESLKTLFKRRASEFAYRRIINVPYPFGSKLDMQQGTLNIYNNLLSLPVNKETFDMKKIEKLLSHVENILVNKNTDHYNYVINWLAHIIQKPAKKTGVSIIFYSLKGTGKGIFLNFLTKKLFGPKYSHSLNTLGKLTRKFNGKLSQKQLVHIDEAKSFSESARSESEILKNIITEPTLDVELKGREVETQPNYINVIMATNNIDSIKLTPDQRRFTVFECSDKKIGDAKYFNKLEKHLTLECASHFHRFLLERDISNFNPGDFPNTKILKRMTVLSLNSMQRFMFDERHNLAGNKYTRKELIDFYEYYLNENRINKKYSTQSTKVVDKFKSFCDYKRRICENGKRLYKIRIPKEYPQIICKELNIEEAQ